MASRFVPNLCSYHPSLMENVSYYKATILECVLLHRSDIEGMLLDVITVLKNHQCLFIL